jgi:hypothetical protein
VSRSPERSRRARARMTEGALARPTTASLQCPAADLWVMISRTGKGDRGRNPAREVPLSCGGTT